MNHALLLVFVGAASLCLPAFGQPSSVPDEDYWASDGTVYAAVETNGIVYIGGAFTQVGPLGGSFVPLDSVSGLSTRRFPRILGSTSTVLADGQGGWFVGGNFSRVGEFQRTNLVHLLADGSVDAFWQVTPNGLPRALSLFGSNLLIGGDFTSINGEARSYLAAVIAATGQLLPLDVAVSAPVRAIAVTANHAYLGGNFLSVGGVARSRLAKIDCVTGAVAGWNPGAADAFYDQGVFLLSILGDRLYVGGDFTQIDDAARNGVAAYQLATETLLTWSPNPSSYGSVRALAVMSNTVFLAGSFAQINGQPRAALAAVDTTNGFTLPWRGDVVGGAVEAIAATNGTIYAGGSFTGLADGGPPRLAALDSLTGATKAWNPVPGGLVLLIALHANEVFAGGEFSIIGGVSRSGLAAIDLSTKRATAWNPGIGGVEGGSRVHALAISEDALFVGGFLYSVGGQFCGGLGAVRLSDGTPLPFDAQVGMPFGSPTILQLAVSGTNLFVRGRFEFIGGGTTADFAVVDTHTGRDTGWDTEPLGGAGGWALSDTTLYVSGGFTTVRGQPRNRLAAFDLATRQLKPWQPLSLAGGVTQMRVNGDVVHLAGDFTTIHGEARTNFAAVDALTGELTSWSMSADASAASIAIGNSVYVAGNFQRLNNESRPGLGSTDALGGATRAWNPGEVSKRSWSAATALTLVPTPDVVIVGGTFDAQAAGFSGTRFFPVTNRAPVLTLASPTNEQVIHLPTPVTIEALPSDPDGSIARIDFYTNRTLFASRTTPPYEATWTPELIGTYLVNAVAYDNLGEPGVTASARVIAQPPLGDVPPAIHITSPANGGTVQAFTNVIVSAEVQDPDSTIARVEFFPGTNGFFTDTTFPYSATLTNLAPGNYSVDARVVDQYGVTVTNGPVAFHVNFPPTVTLSSPANNAVFPVGAGIPMGAVPNDVDGSSLSVSFFANAILVATVSNSPFQFTVTNLAAGTHVIQAQAVDGAGDTSTSGVVTVTVYALPPNDHFAQRSLLPDSVNRVVGTNTYASAESNETSLVLGFTPRKTLWWTWTAPFSGRAFASTRGSSFDTLLGMCVGGNLSDLIRLSLNNNETPQLLSSRVEFQAAAGTNYHFVVDGASGQFGSVVLTVGPVVRLAVTNDVATSLSLHVTGTTNVTYVLQRSTNGIAWSPVQTNVPPSTPFVLTEPKLPLTAR